MITYPKMQNLFERDMTTFKSNGVVRCPEFEIVDKWWVEEKVDGAA